MSVRWDDYEPSLRREMRPTLQESLLRFKAAWFVFLAALLHGVCCKRLEQEALDAARAYEDEADEEAGFGRM